MSDQPPRGVTFGQVIFLLLFGAILLFGGQYALNRVEERRAIEMVKAAMAPHQYTQDEIEAYIKANQ